MMYSMTSPAIVSYEVASADWTVPSLLEKIANANPPYQALIDTGQSVVLSLVSFPFSTPSLYVY